MRTILLAVQQLRMRECVSRALVTRGMAPLPYEGVEDLWSLPIAALPRAAIVDNSYPSGIVQRLTDFMPSMPILVLTGYAPSPRVLTVLGMGNVRVRQKPLDIEQMLEALGVQPLRESQVRLSPAMQLAK